MELLMGKGEKFFAFATKLAQLMWLNILTILCSLPVVTAGAAFTALHRVLVDIFRDEENKITKTYFASFKVNFWQSTKIWLIYLVFYGVLMVDHWALKALDNNTIRYLKLLLPVLVFISSLSLSWVFVMQSRYTLSLRQTLVYSFTRIIAFPVRTLFMAATLLIPFIVIIYIPRLFIILPLLGISGPGIIGTCFYNRALIIMEDDSDEEKEED